VNKIEINEGSGNVYADLGFPAPTEMQIKAGLVMRISEMTENRSLTQQIAAEILGVTQPALSDLLRGRFRGISEAKILDWVNRLEVNAQVEVRNKL